ncbi:AAA family ATPase [Salinibacterium soli]|uniref:AAA family ATPase n=1 Tax=Antiquaquibacter soli TaxID=3064523 RepID=A0ABT9BPS9_9MICO|nr:AAA family ATPase [Protaetiibacter sp. WY-16]MDO7882443.1 AAA family ATPase [Protaetiibacter sp. WY-16]
MSGFRSFGSSEAQKVRVIGPVTLIAGQNNVGKSNALALLHSVMPILRGRQTLDRDDVFAAPEDTPRGWNGDARQMIAAFALGDEDYAQMRIEGEDYRALRKALTSPSFDLDGDGATWFKFDVQQRDRQLSVAPDYSQIAEALNGDTHLLAQLSSLLTNQHSGGSDADWHRIVDSWQIVHSLPETQYLGAMRRITAIDNMPAGTTHLDRPQLDALINQLADHQAPSDSVKRQAMKAKYSELQKFLRSVLDDESAVFEVPGDKKTIYVQTSNGEMQLERLGTGIEEVILIAAAATFPTDTVVCIEEPELHLHPALQRQLVRYLHSQGQNRFVMSTHSAHLLNSPDVTIVRAEMEDGNTHLELAATEADRASLTHALGARPSDVVQSNYVVWAEGPSDRIYLRLWIEALAPDLVEGVHYSIVFYGGRLLAQVGFDDEEVLDLIQLQRMARRYAVVMDSDRHRAADPLNATKQRIVDEATRSGNLAWVTQGREIENYVPVEALARALSEKYPNRTYPLRKGKWEKHLGTPFVGSSNTPSKITIARAIADEGWSGDSWQMDLRDKVAEIVERVRDANR